MPVTLEAWGLLALLFVSACKKESSPRGDAPPETSAPPAEEAGGGLSCDARAAEIDQVLAAATRKCSSDGECACFRGGISKKEPCGGIVDAKTNARFEALAKEWTAAGCKAENVACPAMLCEAKCNAGTCGSAGAVIQ